jgi:hypothetical protein
MPSSKRITVRIPAAIHSRMKTEMEKNKELSVSWIVIDALRRKYGLSDTELHSQNENNGTKADVPN